MKSKCLEKFVLYGSLAAFAVYYGRVGGGVGVGSDIWGGGRARMVTKCQIEKGHNGKHKAKNVILKFDSLEWW